MTGRRVSGRVLADSCRWAYLAEWSKHLVDGHTRSGREDWDWLALQAGEVS